MDREATARVIYDAMGWKAERIAAGKYDPCWLRAADAILAARGEEAGRRVETPRGGKGAIACRTDEEIVDAINEAAARFPGARVTASVEGASEGPGAAR